ncbi:hypothetical protein MTO96_010505 [Rhipicephalus appendiculatus]
MPVGSSREREIGKFGVKPSSLKACCVSLDVVDWRRGRRRRDVIPQTRGTGNRVAASSGAQPTRDAPSLTTGYDRLQAAKLKAFVPPVT